jgi:hypothetical protein
MENQSINVKEKSSEELGLMLGEIAMQINQSYQNYQVVANELRIRMPQVTTSDNLQPKESENGNTGTLP